MLLAIDTGNTNVKFALVNDDGSPRSRWRIATDARRTADEYAVWLLRLIELEGLKREDVTDVAVSTVVPRALYNLQSLAQKYFGVEALIAGRAPMENVCRPGTLPSGKDVAVGSFCLLSPDRFFSLVPDEANHPR
jgi:type III pantothenate kinase